MIGKSTRFACALGLALALAAPSALAQNDTRLSDARQAYAAVDYENTRALAKSAIEQGSNDQATTGELYFLWALAAAALDQADEARSAFSYALAVNPELKVDRSLSPKIRAPYQEARGALLRADGKAPLEVELQRREGKLTLKLRDAQQLTDSIELSTRTGSAEPFAQQRFRARPTREVPLPDARELDYFVRLLDAHGNVLLEQGSQSEPQRLGAPERSSAILAPETKPGADTNRTPYIVTAVTLGALGLAAGGVSTAMFVRRQNAAQDWNGPGCEKPGATRAQQCAKVDDRRRNAEHLSIGFAAAGGALLVGSVVTLLLAPSSKHTNLSLDTTSHSVMLGLSTTL